MLHTHPIEKYAKIINMFKEKEFYCCKVRFDTHTATTLTLKVEEFLKLETSDTIKIIDGPEGITIPRPIQKLTVKHEENLVTI